MNQLQDWFLGDFVRDLTVSGEGANEKRQEFESFYGPQRDEQFRKERQKNSWWTYMTSPIYGKSATETEEQKQQQEIDRIQRLSTKRIKENDLARQTVGVKTLKNKLQDVEGRIAIVKMKNEQLAQTREANKQERTRKDREAKRRAEQQEVRERLANASSVSASAHLCYPVSPS